MDPHSSNMTGSTTSSGGVYYNHKDGLVNGHSQANKMDDHNMMEVLLKSTAYETGGNGAGSGSARKAGGSQYGSTNNLNGASGGLPGVRGRTRQSISGASGGTGAQLDKHGLGHHMGTPTGGKTFTTDTEEDETVDFLLKSTMAIPKGQPPKKRTKKYGERKSCKLYFFFF